MRFKSGGLAHSIFLFSLCACSALALHAARAEMSEGKWKSGGGNIIRVLPDPLPVANDPKSVTGFDVNTDPLTAEAFKSMQKTIENTQSAELIGLVETENARIIWKIATPTEASSPEAQNRLYLLDNEGSRPVIKIVEPTFQKLRRSDRSMGLFHGILESAMRSNSKPREVVNDTQAATDAINRRKLVLTTFEPNMKGDTKKYLISDLSVALRLKRPRQGQSGAIILDSSEDTLPVPTRNAKPAN